MDFTDKPGEIRPGEELNAERLEVYLRKTIPGLSGSMKLLQFPGGASNLTYHVSFGDREMVLRRPPFGTKDPSAHDMRREYRVLTAVHPVYPYAPRPLLYCEDTAVIGCPFYVMERIRGIVLWKDLPEEVKLTPAQGRQLAYNLIRAQFELHSLDYRAMGLENFGKPEGYAERQVLGWNRRYRNARSPDAPEAGDLMDWLEKQLPADEKRSALIHNDFKLNNVLVDPADPVRIVGVLDWEMATIGDPILDLFGSIVYVIEPGDPPEMEAMNQWPPSLRSGVTRKELLEYYGELSGLEVKNFDYYYCFALFRLAVIYQQLYYRYYMGQTQDQRFAPMLQAVHALINLAEEIKERSAHS